MELSFLIQNLSLFAFGSAPQLAHYSHTEPWCRELYSIALCHSCWVCGTPRLCCMDACGPSWLDIRCPPKPVYPYPLQQGRGEGNTMKGLRVSVRTGRDQSAVTVLGKTNPTWGNMFNVLPTKSE